MKFTGTIARGIKGPIIRSGDNIIEIIAESIQNVVSHEEVVLNDGDIICITESVIATAQGNFASLDQIATDISNKFTNDAIGVLFPILSRNRFASILEAIKRTNKKIILQLSYPADEVGNKLISEDDLIKYNINPYQDVFTLEEFRKYFPDTKHQFTNVDYIDFYQDIIGPNGKIIFSNNPQTILDYTCDVLVSNVHNRKNTINRLIDAGGKTILGLADILTHSINGSGYNREYGLLGANAATEDSVKLFPRDSDNLVNQIKNHLYVIFNKHLEVMVYGDGAIKDPQGGIWELCDPVVSPGYTSGLEGTPNEIKLKYLAANQFGNYDQDQAQSKLKKLIKQKTNQTSYDASLGTTPRQITDLIGSLADLVSGSGDKGTPFVLIQNYFTNYATE